MEANSGVNTRYTTEEEVASLTRCSWVRIPPLHITPREGVPVKGKVGVKAHIVPGK